MEMIDINCHWMPERYYNDIKKLFDIPQLMFERAKKIPAMTDLNIRLEMMDLFPGYKQIPSLVSPPIEALAGPEDAPEIAQLANDSMAECCSKYPERFPKFVACLPSNNADAMLLEAKRVITDLPAAGVQIFSNCNGKPIDTPEFFALFDLMAGLDKPVWLHPTRGINHPDYLSEDYSRYEIWWSLGWPYESSAAMARLVFSGVFDRWPHLKIITHHAGGIIPMMEGRLSAGMQIMGSRTPDDKKYLSENNIKQLPLGYFKKFYADTASFGSTDAIDFGIKFFGAEHMLFATDSPFDFQGGAQHIKQTIDAINSLKLTAREKERIFNGNIKNLIS